MSSSCSVLTEKDITKKKQEKKKARSCAEEGEPPTHFVKERETKKRESP
jgi:hypothetical protein